MSGLRARPVRIWLASESAAYTDRLTAGLAEHVAHEMDAAREVRFNRHRPLWRSRLPEAVARLTSPLL